jgi:hypothetical protein
MIRFALRLRRTILSTAALAVLLGLAFSEFARAEFITPDASMPPFRDWARGAANSVYAEWDVFTVPFGAPGNAPDVGSFPSTGSPDGGASLIVSNLPGAFLTGGNIYSPTVATAFTGTIPAHNRGPGWNTRVVFQLQTRGSFVDPNSVELSCLSGPSEVFLDWTAHYELASIPLGGFGGFQVDRMFVFDIPAFNPAALELNFVASESSMSLSRVAIDTFTTQAPLSAVPEPASFAMAGLGLAGVLALRLRKRSDC